MKENRVVMNENRVVDLLREWLSKDGYEIKGYKHYTQQGHDMN